jgi:hypothetical protein
MPISLGEPSADVESQLMHDVAVSLGSASWLGAAVYGFSRSPEAADLSMAAMTSWRRTASAKSGTL